MNKHNIIELCDYKKEKDKVKNEHDCFAMLDGLKDRINMSHTYYMSFKQYIDCMLRNNSIKKSFADNLIQQVDLIMKESLNNKKDIKNG